MRAFAPGSPALMNCWTRGADAEPVQHQRRQLPDVGHPAVAGRVSRCDRQYAVDIRKVQIVVVAPSMVRDEDDGGVPKRCNQPAKDTVLDLVTACDLRAAEGVAGDDGSCQEAEHREPETEARGSDIPGRQRPIERGTPHG